MRERERQLFEGVTGKHPQPASQLRCPKRSPRKRMLPEYGKWLSSLLTAKPDLKASKLGSGGPLSVFVWSFGACHRPLRGLGDWSFEDWNERLCMSQALGAGHSKAFFFPPRIRRRTPGSCRRVGLRSCRVLKHRGARCEAAHFGLKGTRADVAFHSHPRVYPPPGDENDGFEHFGTRGFGGPQHIMRRAAWIKASSPH